MEERNSRADGWGGQQAGLGAGPPTTHTFLCPPLSTKLGLHCWDPTQTPSWDSWCLVSPASEAFGGFAVLGIHLSPEQTPLVLTITRRMCVAPAVRQALV